MTEARGLGAARTSERDDPTCCLDEASDIWRRGPDAADRDKIIVGCPTGNSTTLSNMDRHVVFECFGDEVAERWHAEALQTLAG